MTKNKWNKFFAHYTPFDQCKNTLKCKSKYSIKSSPCSKYTMCSYKLQNNPKNNADPGNPWRYMLILKGNERQDILCTMVYNVLFMS